MNSTSALIDIPLSSLKNSVLDLGFATPQRFRLLDCVHFASNRSLRIHELTHPPPSHTIPYTAISYVWRGNTAIEEDISGTFSVKGAEDGDAISITALYHACLASLQSEIEYIWLDRLCILQTNKDDKAWQIGCMFEIYRSCRICLILPGGIGRLVGLEEETAWIHRAWTLQEALAPECALILFAWTHGETEVDTSIEKCSIIQVVPLRSAVVSLKSLLRIYFASKKSVKNGSKDLQIKPGIFGKGTAGRMPVLALSGTMAETNPEARAQAIWRCALMRTSSRPVDMIFSIMGLFGITLNPREFTKDDRINATIALAQEILRKGGKASWLGASLRLTPSTQLSSFPQFPTSSVSSLPCVRMQGGTRDVRDMLANVDYDSWIDDLPSGKMDDDGYFILREKAIALNTTKLPWFFKPQTMAVRDGELLIRAKDGSIWEIRDDKLDASTYLLMKQLVKERKEVQKPKMVPVDATTTPALTPEQPSYSLHDHCRAFAVRLGRVRPYTIPRPTAQPKFLRAILVIEHIPGRFHRTSYFELDDDFDMSVVAWPEYEFYIGGPEPSKRAVVQPESRAFQGSRDIHTGDILNPVSPETSAGDSDTGCVSAILRLLGIK